MDIRISDSAIDKIASLLQNEDDLVKTNQFKKQFVQEKSTIDIELRSTFQNQIQTTMSGLKTLQQSQNQIDKIKSNFNKISKVSVENKQSIENFELVNETSKIYDFFNKVNKIYNHILHFNDEIKYINDLIDQDVGAHVEDNEDDIEDKVIIDTDMTLPNLFKIHYCLNKLRDMKDQLDEYADNVSNDYKSIITKLFYPLKYAVMKFDKILEEIISMLIESCKENNVELILILIKILDVEEREDLKINCTLTIVEHRVLGLIKKSMEDQGMKYTIASKIDEGSNNKNRTNNPQKLKLTFQQQQIYDKNFANIKNQLMQNNSITRLKPRNYLDWFFKILEKSVAETFSNCDEHFRDKAKDEPGLYFEILDNLEWIFDDLNMVKNFIDINLVPKRWNFFQKIFDIYTRNCQKLLTNIIDMEPETLIILSILDYDKKYGQFLKESLAFKKSEIKSVIGDDQKEKLLQDYMGLIVGKMKDWMFNLKRTEEDVFIKREAPPDTDEEGLLGFEGSNVVFRMFIQQADVAAGSGQGRILAGVIGDFCTILIDRQKSWSGLVQSEVQKLLQFNHEESQEEGFPGGLLEYIVALANDQIRGADFIESMKSKYIKMVSKKYSSTMDENLDNVVEGFINSSKECLETLIAIMFDDLTGPFKQIFTKEWYNDSGHQAKQICDTLMEYISDIQPLMNPLLFDIIIENIVDELLIKYLGALDNKHIHSNFSSQSKKLKIIEKIKLDVSIFFPTFDQFYEGLEGKFRIVEYLIDFIYLDSEEEIVEKFKELVIDFSDVPIDFIGKIMKAKKLDSKKADFIMEECNNAKNEYLSQLTDPIPTFMERLSFDRKK
ncbi:SNARE-binding exocyst subunit [Saccharomycopsis crataegensis]|uniref:SNARE-binding exocyst subunit n=1 Tax=Saccharomycopsis crataegensis TaxID=43959 RepID=A0AAV5QHX0_9ASCO|nr:SNARE-binding exocyst subunit [Saccharomycopsis crataegensis]